MSDSSRITAPIPSVPSPTQPPDSTQSSWFSVVRNACNPMALFGRGLKDVGNNHPPISPVFLDAKDTAEFPDMEKAQQMFDTMVPPAPEKRKAPPPKPQVAQPEETVPPQILDIPNLTTTPAIQIASIPEAWASSPEPVESLLEPSLAIPTSSTTPASQIAEIAEEDTEAHPSPPPEPATPPPSPASNTLLTVANKVGAAATVTGTVAKGIDLVPGGAGVKQKAMGKIHALYQAIPFPSLSLGKVYQGTKALYQMASSIKSSHLIGAAIVGGGLYWWFKRPSRARQGAAAGAQMPVVVNVTIHNANNNTNNNDSPKPGEETRVAVTVNEQTRQKPPPK